MPRKKQEEPEQKETAIKQEKPVIKETAKQEEQSKKFYRSATDRIIGGVCGGIARYFNIDSTLVRLAFVLFTLTVHNGFLLYLILWLVVPPEGGRKGEGLKELRPRQRRSLITAILLILIGLIFLFNNFQILPWGVWGFLWKLWPIFLILAGLEIFLGVNLLGELLIIILAVIVSLFVLGFLLSLSNRNLKENLQKRLPFWLPDKWEQWFEGREKSRQPRIEFDFLEEIFPLDQV